jgi:hypothetical protein
MPPFLSLPTYYSNFDILTFVILDFDMINASSADPDVHRPQEYHLHGVVPAPGVDFMSLHFGRTNLIQVT